MVDAARVVQINRKPYTSGAPGLPKMPVAVVGVTTRGIDGDFNVYRHEKKHDTPDRALLLYVADQLKTLNEEGWPVRAGDIGENLLLEGVRYEALQPGTRWQVGTRVVLEVTEACHPCKTLGHLPYVGPDRVRDFIAIMKGRRGWYAKVLREGTVQQGDRVEPALADHV